MNNNKPKIFWWLSINMANCIYNSIEILSLNNRCQIFNRKRERENKRAKYGNVCRQLIVMRHNRFSWSDEYDLSVIKYSLCGHPKFAPKWALIKSSVLWLLWAQIVQVVGSKCFDVVREMGMYGFCWRIQWSMRWLVFMRFDTDLCWNRMVLVVGVCNEGCVYHSTALMQCNAYSYSRNKQ